MIAGAMSEMACLQQELSILRQYGCPAERYNQLPERSASGLHRYILRYFLNKSFSVTRWPDSNVPVVDSVICCPSAETTHLSF
jgi:hypothetical protein